MENKFKKIMEQKKEENKNISKKDTDNLTVKSSL